jgi:hypothetical protein
MDCLPVFGFRAAGAALLANLGSDRGGVLGWIPEEIKMV